ncbi:type II toxin-antitoxin system RelE family toxin [Paenibacillus medicaginis]|uniref:Type II toxin-antitoxin system RelE/ParE family toxin n=1 Tax=Paenibacillus medicaginis TaxID=1470560 RepID=A0ABV5C4S1_9BACL
MSDKLKSISEQINSILSPYNVVVKFGDKAIEDLISYQKEQQELIIALIIKRGIHGPLLKPNGIGEPLRGKLNGFAKIKHMKPQIRVVYRPIRNGIIRMEVIAIGPRDRKEAYNKAAERIIQFKSKWKTPE